MKKGKTGGGGGEWIEFDSPKPPRVPEDERYGGPEDYNNEPSERCLWWLRQIERGWRPNNRMLRCCWDCNSERLGVRGWEYIDLIWEALRPEQPQEPLCAPSTVARVSEKPDPLAELKAEIRARYEEMIVEEIEKQILWGNGGGDLKGIRNGID